MTRPHRSVVIVCIVAVALAAVLPGGPALDFALLEPSWVLLPDLAPVVVPLARVADEQPQSLRSLVPSRAPPSSALS